MIGCVEFTFNASFFFVWCGASFLFGVALAELIRHFFNLYKVPVVSL